MDRRTAEPPEGWYEGEYGPEARCCLSLLERHPYGNEGGSCPEDREAERTVRALIKAGEKGQKAYAALCRELHREWAGRLRRKEPIPGIHPGFFGKEQQ